MQIKKYDKNTIIFFITEPYILISSDIRNIQNSSRKGIEHFLKRSSLGKRPSGNKRAKGTSTVTASLKDVFFLMGCA